MIVATETVLFAVLGEPVDEQVPVAPVADRARGHPLQPLHVGPRVDDHSVVTLGDRGATDHQELGGLCPPAPESPGSKPTVSTRPRKSGSSRTPVPSVGPRAPPRLAQHPTPPTPAAPPTPRADPPPNRPP